MPTATVLRCLSVRQPWAWAICVGEKSIENRTKSTSYRGPVAIHASSSKHEINSVIETAKGKVDADTFASGAVIGVAELIDVVEMNTSLESSMWAEGPYCWLFANAKLLRSPIPFKGKLNLYALPEDIAGMVQGQLEGAGRPPQNEIDDCIGAMKSDRIDLLLLRAKNYGKLELFDDAIRNCDEVIGLQPDNADAYRVRAFAHTINGNHQQCLLDCNQALKLDPNDADAYYILGIAYEKLGDTDKSTWNRQKAAEIDPTIGDDQQENEEHEG